MHKVSLPPMAHLINFKEYIRGDNSLRSTYLYTQGLGYKKHTPYSR